MRALMPACVCLFMLGAMRSEARQPDAATQAVDTLRNTFVSDGQEGVLAARPTVARMLGAVDPEEWGVLRGALEDETLHIVARLLLLEVAVAQANGIAQDRVLETLDVWAREADFNAEGARDGPLESRLVLLAAILRQFEQGTWLQRVGDRSSTLEGLACFAVRCPSTVDARKYAVRVVQRAQASVQLRERVADQAMTLYPESRGLPQVLVALLGQSAIVRLRNLADVGAGSPETFNWQAGWWLSHLGDEQAINRFESLRAAFGAIDRGYAARLQWYIWRIRVQRPPEGLLAYIRAAPGREGVHDRVWAIERASELGLSKELLREAILECARHAEADAVVDIKAVGLQVGALQEGDLPGVPAQGDHR